MQIFHYHPETGLYLGSSDARPDPLEWALARAAVADPLKEAARVRYAAAIFSAGKDPQAIEQASAALETDLAAADLAAAQVQPENFMVPANATGTAPPAFGFDEQAVMTPEGWIVGPAPETEPPAAETPEDLASAARAMRDALIADDRWLVERHRDQVDLGVATSLAAGQYQDLLTYIQGLRNVPQQPGFPQVIEWPARPELPAA